MERLLRFTLLWLIILATLNSCLCYDAILLEDHIKNTYLRLIYAEERGANVREAALKLNRALQLIREAKNNPENESTLLSEAYMLIEDVNASIPSLIREGESAIFWKNVVICLVTILTAVAGILVYRFGPKVFWETWLKLRSQWIIEITRSYRGGRDEH